MEVLRPKPPVFVYEYKSGDAVEVWMDNRWRKGRFSCFSYHPKVCCEIYQSENETGEDRVFCLKRNVRPSQHWRVKDGVGVWKHKRVLKLNRNREYVRGCDNLCIRRDESSVLITFISQNTDPRSSSTLGTDSLDGVDVQYDTIRALNGQKMAFVVGEQVEFTGVESAFTRATYSGRVIRMGDGVVDVAHDHAIGADGYPSVESVAIERVRPFPEQFQMPIYTGDAVEVWLSGAWWLGKCVGEEDNAWVVCFDFKPPAVSSCKHAKPIVHKHQDSIIGPNVSHWRYCDSIWPSFSVGSRIEVLGLEPFYGSAYVGGKIRRFRPDGVDVQYDTIRALNGRKFVSFVPHGRLRPYPLSWVGDYRPGDVLDAWDGHAWWPGLCVRMEQDRYVIRFHHRFASGTEMTIQVGDKVEVIGFEPGFEHSYFAGKVIRDYNDTFEVQYEDLVDTKGGEQIIEMIDAVHVRPYPPHIDYNIHNFERGDVVDVLYKDGWWDGIIHDVFYNTNNQKRYEVFFDYMWGQQRYESYKPEKVRPHQFWVMVNNERRWIPAARVKMEEEVEITGERRWM
ncbi:hypothetical protein LXL04_024582 [Taraxacum kok-saghyz]